MQTTQLYIYIYTHGKGAEKATDMTMSKVSAWLISSCFKVQGDFIFICITCTWVGTIIDIIFKNAHLYSRERKL